MLSLSLALSTLLFNPTQSNFNTVEVILTDLDGDPVVSISSEVTIQIDEKSGTSYAIPPKTAVEFSITKEGIKFKDRTLKSKRISLSTESGAAIRVGKRQYRGKIAIEKTDSDSMRVTNQVFLEDYLRGVLPGELPPDALPQAMAAQAVAARTYVLAEIERGKPIFDSVASQVYLGKSGETSKGDEAVAHTKGLVLRYDGKMFLTYFHSTCGGHTGDPLSILGESTCPPLRGVACGFCSEKNSKYFRWETVLPKKVMGAVASEKRLGWKVVAMSAGKKDPWGRWLSVQIDGNQKGLDLRGDLFRAAVNPKLSPPANVRSLKITNWVEEEHQYLIEGQGWGHGVGMCQIGAMEMARLGYTFEKILAHYYPDSKLEKFSTTKN